MTTNQQKQNDYNFIIYILTPLAPRPEVGFSLRYELPPARSILCDLLLVLCVQQVAEVFLHPAIDLLVDQPVVDHYDVQCSIYFCHPMSSIPSKCLSQRSQSQRLLGSETISSTLALSSLGFSTYNLPSAMVAKCHTRYLNATCVLLLFFSPGKYACLIWSHFTHAKLEDTALNQTYWIITIS